MQPLVFDEKVVRFKRNKIVERLLDDGPFDMNAIALWDVPKEDREQFAQLIGYSVSGFGELSYASPAVVNAADRAADKMLRRRKR